MDETERLLLLFPSQNIVISPSPGPDTMLSVVCAWLDRPYAGLSMSVVALCLSWKGSSSAEKTAAGAEPGRSSDSSLVTVNILVCGCLVMSVFERVNVVVSYSGTRAVRVDALLLRPPLTRKVSTRII